MALDNWSPGGTHFDGSTQPPSLFDDTFNDFVNDLLESFAVRHSLTGEMKFNVGIEADKPASPTVGDAYLNMTTGLLEIYRTAIQQYIVGTVDLDAGASGDDVTVVANAGSPDFTQVHAAGVVPTYIVFWESGTDTVADAVAIHKIDSSSQFTLAASYAGTTGAGINYVIRFTAAATWFPANRAVFNDYTTEHYLNGTHNIPIRTDGTDPDNVENGNAWFDTASGDILKFRAAGTTRTISTGLPEGTAIIDVPMSAVDSENQGDPYKNTGLQSRAIGLYVPVNAVTLNFRVRVEMGSRIISYKSGLYADNDFASAAGAADVEVEVVGATGTSEVNTALTIPVAMRGTVAMFAFGYKKTGGSTPGVALTVMGPQVTTAVAPTSIDASPTDYYPYWSTV